MSQDTADRIARQALGCHGIPPIVKAREAHGCHGIPLVGKLGKLVDVTRYYR